VAPAESLDRGGIVGRVDGRIVVPGDSLEEHGSGIAVLVPASMVRTGVPTRLIIGGWQTAVGANQGLGEFVGSAVDVVRLDGDDFFGSRLEAINGSAISVHSSARQEGGEDVLSSHVEFHESFNLDSSFVVMGGNLLRTEETGFLSGIEMELDRGGGLELVAADQGAEDLHGIHGTGTILTRRNQVSTTVMEEGLETTYIVSTRGTPELGRVQVDRVLVRTEDRDGTGGGTIDPGDHGKLKPRVCELFDRDSRLSGLRGDIVEFIEDPLGGVSTGA